jgi:hypothetical protein
MLSWWWTNQWLEMSNYFKLPMIEGKFNNPDGSSLNVWQYWSSTNSIFQFSSDDININGGNSGYNTEVLPVRCFKN